MKKTMSLILALLLVCIFSTTAMAKSDNGNAWGKGHKSKVVDTQQQQLLNYGKERKDSKKVERVLEKIQKKINKNLLYQYQAEKQNNKKVKANHFSDTYRHWASQCIEEMATIGLLKGYPDGTFRPDQRLSQAEALSLVMRIAAEEAGVTVNEDKAVEDEDEKIDEDKLDDVPDWVWQDCYKAAKKGIINLNRFHSGVQASRAQTAVMIAKILELEPVDTSNIPFKDGILISREDVGYILALYEEGIISGDTNGNFNPNSAITRAQMASMLQRLLDKNEDKGEIKSITLPATASLEQGKSITLAAIVKYSDDTTDNKVEWVSSDTSLATVTDDGVVTAAVDKTGTVTITATATRGDSTMSATCKVIIVEEIVAEAGTLETTGNVSSCDGEVFQEYSFEVDGEKVSLDEDNVRSITMQKDDTDVVTLTPNNDSTFWFNVQYETGKYTLTVVDKADKVYEAIIDWVAPIKVAAIATGNSGVHEGNNYVEFRLGDLDLSSFTHMYQIKPNDQVVELTPNSDTNLWFKTNGQVAGEHTFLINKNNVWYIANISI
ncbi:MAG: S-layer homology domain-containing protein [Syntrophomonadaceae bacterium]|jgi:hypothetical protein